MTRLYKKPLPSRDRVVELLNYDPLTGDFTWKGRFGSVVAGQQVGRKSKPRGAYVQVKIDRVLYMAHRIAWLYVYGEYSGEIDHKDGNRSNNRIDNLRVATRAENSANRRLLARKNGTGFKGVQFKDGKWRARIGHQGRLICLGSFASGEAAHAAYLAAAQELFGEFARAA